MSSRSGKAPPHINKIFLVKDKYDKDKNILSRVTVEDIKKFGMIPEFIGRLPIIYTLEGLTREMMVKILKEPKNAILKQYQKLLELDEVKLEFSDDALEVCAIDLNFISFLHLAPLLFVFCEHMNNRSYI